jgi:hypothetical protein
VESLQRSSASTFQSSLNDRLMSKLNLFPPVLRKGLIDEHDPGWIVVEADATRL